MEKLTYEVVREAAKKAYLEGRLQAQACPSLGCVYRAGGGYSADITDDKWDKTWPDDQPLIVCAIGAAISDELYQALKERGLLTKGIGAPDWREFFSEDTSDYLRCVDLQHAHDRWCGGAGDDREFRKLIGLGAEEDVPAQA